MAFLFLPFINTKKCDIINSRYDKIILEVRVIQMSKDSKMLFYTSIIFLFFSLIGIFLFVYSLNDYARSKTCYDELIYKEIILSNIEKDDVTAVLKVIDK